MTSNLIRVIQFCMWDYVPDVYLTTPHAKLCILTLTRRGCKCAKSSTHVSVFTHSPQLLFVNYTALRTCAGGSSWGSAVDQQATSTASSGQVGDRHRTSSSSCTTVVLTSPFRRRSQFISRSWSEKRGRHGGGVARTRRGRRRLSDPELVDHEDRGHTAGQTGVKLSVFCRSDWKRQVVYTQ